MTKSRSLLRWGLVGGVVGAISLAASASQAQVNVYNGSGLNIDIGMTAGAAYITTRNTNFGAGKTGDSSNQSVTYEEGYVQPAIYLTYDDVYTGQVYVTGSLVGGATRGDGDPVGLTNGHPEDIDGEDYYIGWTGDVGGVGVDLTYGKQEYHVGTDFILGIGHFDNGNDGNYWLAPRYSFERVAKLRLDNVGLDGLMMEGFFIESDMTQADTDFAGVNLEYTDDTLGNVGFMYFNILRAGNPSFVANADHRDDLNVLDFRASGNPITSMMPNWHFAFEYTTQNADQGGSVAKVDADAWYVDIGYTFADWPWSPDLTYRFAHFSGDDPATSGTDEAYDPLFYGFTGWGTWFIGEITGEYILFNTNFDVNMLMATASPYDNLFLTAAYFDFQINETGDAFNLGTTGADDDFGQELNLIADWSVNDNMAISAVYAALIPGGNAEALNGGADNIYNLLEAGAWIWF